MIGIMPAKCLDIHADYLCGHAGACCTAGWAIPADGPALARIVAAFGDSSVVRREAGHTGGARAILRTRDGACTLHDAGTMRCRAHATLGIDGLPSACRHFPRVVLHDPRGTFLTLSHFCPTAAGLLFGAAGVHVVDAPGTLVPPGPLEGLDATGALPPNLTPRMLMDLHAFDEWERRALAMLTEAAETPHEALDLLAGATAAILPWTPDVPYSLCAWVSRAFDAPHRRAGERDRAELVDLARSSVPTDLGVPVRAGVPLDVTPVLELLQGEQAAVRRYLAARLFASWVPYFATSLATLVETLRITLAVLESEIDTRLGSTADPAGILRDAIRHTDLLMVHLSDTRTLVHLIERRS